jgi:hypothetical protein
VPRIIVQAEANEKSSGAVVLEEHVNATHLESDHCCAQLIERLGWAVLDAEDLERARAA